MSNARQQSADRKNMRIATGIQNDQRKNNNRKSLGEQFRQVINGKVITHYTSASLERKRIFIKKVRGISI